MEAVNRRCPDCDDNTNWVSQFRFCPVHGKEVSDYVKPRCRNCQSPTNREYRFCSDCGHEHNAKETE